MREEQTCPFTPPKGREKKAKIRINREIREKIIADSFALFEQWHEVPYKELAVKGPMAANTPPRGICQAGAEVCNNLGLNHSQRYRMLEAVLAHAWAQQEEAHGRGKWVLTWNPKLGRYDRGKVEEE